MGSVTIRMVKKSSVLRADTREFSLLRRRGEERRSVRDSRAHTELTVRGPWLCLHAATDVVMSHGDD